MEKDPGDDTTATVAERHRRLGYHGENVGVTIPHRAGKSVPLEATHASNFTKRWYRVEILAKIQNMFKVNSLFYKIIGRSISNAIEPKRREDELAKLKAIDSDERYEAWLRTYQDK
ncbi:MAG TPA: hypothetical protein VI819_02625 [Patescibacteria group bacterium]|nr:hypothetical protein [Patescibacteria group bacterium]